MPHSIHQDCTLILTEGDSAKTLAVSGLGVVGRDRYGVFPLKGKLLNVREATPSQVLKNEEIQVLYVVTSAERSFCLLLRGEERSRSRLWWPN